MRRVKKICGVLVLVLVIMFTSQCAYAAMSYAAQGLGGTSINNYVPAETNLFVLDGADKWVLDVTYSSTQNSFRLLGRENGVSGQNWTNRSVISAQIGTGVRSASGTTLRLNGFTDGDKVRITLTLNNGRYTVSARLLTLKITSSVVNPVDKGSTVTLTATGALSACMWQYSYDGVSWEPYTGPTSGTYGETISVNATSSIYYKASTSYASDTYKIYVFIQCSGRSIVQFYEDFGSLPYAEARRTDAHIPSSYIFAQEGYEIHDGFYAVMSNSKYAGRGTCNSCSVRYPCPDLSCLRPASTTGDYWYADRRDHTGNENGGMLFLNCNKTGEVMYSYTQTGLCKNVYMTFSVWFASAKSGNPIQTRFVILDQNGAEILSARYDTEAISVNDGWRQFQTAFFSGDNESLTIQIINNGISGEGNDILIDDISFTSCVPKLEIQPVIDVDCGETSVMTVESSGIDQIFGMEPYYLWQMYDYNAIDSENPWIDVPDDSEAGNSSIGGSGYGKVSYGYVTRHEDNVPRFRVIMSSTPEMARLVGHSIYPECTVYAETNVVEVDCQCGAMEAPTVKM